MDEKRLIDLTYKIAEGGKANFMGTAAILFNLTPQEMDLFLKSVEDYLGRRLNIVADMLTISDFSFDYLNSKGISVPQEVDSVKLFNSNDKDGTDSQTFMDDINSHHMSR